MSSYFTSYFSNSTSSQSGAYQTPPAASTPSGAASTWSKTISSRLAGLRTALTNNSEQDDPENEDCSHVSDVLRAYYTQKGLPFPPWLPPDPRKPIVAAAAPPPIQYGQYGAVQYSGYGVSVNPYNNSAPGSNRSSGASGRGVGLSDLWESTPSQQQQPAAAPQSLRAPRYERPVPQSLQSSHNPSSTVANSGLTPSQQPSARPLPSQRAGSYQTLQNTGSTSSIGSRDRLKARLQAGRGGNDRGTPTPPPASDSSGGGGGSYSQSAYGGGGGGSNGTYNSSSQGNSAGSPSPYLGATQPWAGGDYENFDGGYGSGGAGGAGKRSGMTGGPMANRSRPGGPR